MKNTHGGVLLLVKLQAGLKVKLLSIGVFHVFEVAQMVPNRVTHHISVK